MMPALDEMKGGTTPSATLTAPDLRVEPQFGPSAGALRSYDPHNRFILAGGKLHDARSLATIRRNAGEQLVCNGSAVRDHFIVRDIETWSIVNDFTDYFKDASTAHTTMSDDGAYLAWFGNRDWSEQFWTQVDRLQILRSETQAVILDAHLEGALVRGLEFAADNEELWVWLGYDHLAIFSLASGERRDRRLARKDGSGSRFQWWTANRLGVTITASEIPKAPTSGPDAHRNFLTVEDARSGTPIATLCRPDDDDLAAHHVAWGDRSAAFSQDSSLFGVLVARDEDGIHQFTCEAIVWETTGWKEVRRIAVTPFNPGVSMEDRPILRFDPGNRRLQVGYEEYDLVTGHLIRSFANDIDHRLLARSRGSNTARVVRVHHDGAIATWDVVEGQQVGQSRLAGKFLALSDDGALIASYRSVQFQGLAEKWYDDHEPFEDDRAEFTWKAARSCDAIIVQHTATGEVMHVLRTCVSRFDAVAFAADNGSLVASHWDLGAASSDLWARDRHASQYHHYLISWDLKTGALRWVTDQSHCSARNLTFSSDGKLFATSHVESQNASKLRVFDTLTGAMLWNFPFGNWSYGDSIENIYFDNTRAELIVCGPWWKVISFNLITGEKRELPIESHSLVLSSDRPFYAWAGGIRKWGDDGDILSFLYAQEMRGVDGTFRGDAFYGCFWPDRKACTRVIYYRLSDGELLGGWDCGFVIDEIRVVDARTAGRPASLIALSECQAKVWGDQISADGLLIEFLPAGALLREGSGQPSWTAEAIPHLRAYRGTQEISLAEYLKQMQS